MKRTKPPYRADHVGSFLRTPAIKEAREKREKGQISADDLKKVEELGGKVVMPEFPIGQWGAMAIFLDPTGNRVALWKDAQG